MPLPYALETSLSKTIFDSRWEVEIDGVFLDGEKLPDITQQADDISTPPLSALIDSVSTASLMLIDALV